MGKTAFRNKLLQNSFDLRHVRSVLRLAGWTASAKPQGPCGTGSREILLGLSLPSSLKHAQSVGDGSRTKNSGFQTSTRPRLGRSERTGLNLAQSRTGRIIRSASERNSVHVPASSQTFHVRATLLSRPSTAVGFAGPIDVKLAGENSDSDETLLSHVYGG